MSTPETSSLTSRPAKTAGKTAGKTRQRVLDAALRLFNERGPASVTTAEIAAATGIREGNLHYHFRKKEEIVAALLETFEAELLATSSAPLGDPSKAESYRRYQFGWFGLMWRFRCFYRDSHALPGLAPSLATRLAAAQARAQASVRLVLAKAVVNGVLAASADQIERLLANAWIVSSYWMNHHRAMHPRSLIEKPQLLWGFRQILALYEPYVTEAGRALVQPLSDSSLLESIIDDGGPTNVASSRCLDDSVTAAR